MKILAIHSRYRISGGEDRSFLTETSLLQDNGHDVLPFTQDSTILAENPPIVQAVRTIWNARALRELNAILQTFRPDVAYVNNLFPAMSGSVLKYIADNSIPAVFAVRNYRLGCIAGTAYRGGASCSLCFSSRVPVPGIRHACYNDSIRQSLVAGLSTGLVRHLAITSPQVRFAAVSEHMRNFLLDLGITDTRITVKHNTVMVDAPAPEHEPSGFLYIGRLEEEKGILTLLDAVHMTPNATLTIVGDGTMNRTLAELAQRPRVTITGPLPHDDVLRLMANSLATVVPSLWEEPFGRVAMESLACGTPVIASKVGGLTDIVADAICGRLVEPGSAASLSNAMCEALNQASWRDQHRHAARHRFETRFSPSAVTAVLENCLQRSIR